MKQYQAYILKIGINNNSIYLRRPPSMITRRLIDKCQQNRSIPRFMFSLNIFYSNKSHINRTFTCNTNQD